MELAWTVLPMPKAATAVSAAKITPSHFAFIPRSRTYIGPPAIEPFAFFTRKRTERSASEYFVAMPKTPVSHIQRTAPGPPAATAVATPTMFPVPIVAARAVVSAPNWLTSPAPSFWRRSEILMAVQRYRWMKPRRNGQEYVRPDEEDDEGPAPDEVADAAPGAARSPPCRPPPEANGETLRKPSGRIDEISRLRPRPRPKRLPPVDRGGVRAPRRQLGDGGEGGVPVQVGQRRVVVERLGDLGRRRLHLQVGLPDVDELARRVADDVDADEAAGPGVEEELQEALGVADDLAARVHAVVARGRRRSRPPSPSASPRSRRRSSPRGSSRWRRGGSRCSRRGRSGRRRGASPGAPAPSRSRRGPGSR